MKLKEEEIENLKIALTEKYAEFYDDLVNKAIDDFINVLPLYEADTNLTIIINDIANGDIFNDCNIFKNAKFIAENIFEFNNLCEEIISVNKKNNFKIYETNINLMKVYIYIYENTVLAENCKTLEELINKIAEEY